MSVLLPIGLILFTGTHLALSLAPGTVDARRAAIGEGPVKGIVALLSAAGLVLIVMGWRGSIPTPVYSPTVPAAGLILIVLGIYLFVVSNRPSAIKRVLRHPQLTGMALWSAGHLCLNGDSRSLLLFGWLAAWAVLEILLINRRDGAWSRPAAPPLTTDLVTLVVTVIVIAVLAWGHPWLAGVPALRGL